MLITAKFTKLGCFVNTVVQLCLILGKLLYFSSYVTYDLSQTVRKSLAGCKGAYDLSALSHFNAVI